MKRHFVFPALLVCTVLLAGAEGFAQDRAEPIPEELVGIGIEERLDEQIPLDATFMDSQGQAVELGRYFDGDRPVILVPVYYNCPMLCGRTMNGLLDALEELEWTAGEEFRVVTFSFNPRETSQLARAKRQTYLKEYGRSVANEGWEFLTGTEEQIRRVTGAVGFRYRWNEKQQEYVHTAALIVCTPQGRVSQYMYGVMYEPKSMRLLLADASDGKVGSPLDRILLFCFHYDPASGTYAPAAVNLMRAGGVITILILAAALLPAWVRAARKTSRATAAAAVAKTSTDEETDRTADRDPERDGKPVEPS